MHVPTGLWDVRHQRDRGKGALEKNNNREGNDSGRAGGLTKEKGGKGGGSPRKTCWEMQQEPLHEK